MLANEVVALGIQTQAHLPVVQNGKKQLGHLHHQQIKQQALIYTSGLLVVLQSMSQKYK